MRLVERASWRELGDFLLAKLRNRISLGVLRTCLRVHFKADRRPTAPAPATTAAATIGSTETIQSANPTSLCTDVEASHDVMTPATVAAETFLIHSRMRECYGRRRFAAQLACLLPYPVSARPNPYAVNYLGLALYIITQIYPRSRPSH